MPDNAALAAEGKLLIELAEKGMSALVQVGERFAKEKPFVGLRSNQRPDHS